MTTETDARLYRIRSLAHLARNGHEVSIATLANEILTLDAHLSGGGQPPEAWREGPDAPPRGHKDRLIMAADLLNMDPNDLMTALDNTARDEDEPERCHVILGHEDEGGQRQCARVAGHPYPHSVRP